jgi:hypothetical protein
MEGRQMDTYIYNKHYNLWTHVPSNTHISQEYIDSVNDDILRAYLYAETKEVVSDVMIDMFRSIPIEIKDS